MFMFRKKEEKVSTTEKSKNEAKKFQEAVREVNKNVNPNDLDIHMLESVADKKGVELSRLKETFETYLRKNALKEIGKVKKDDYSYMELHKASEKYGFDLDDLEVSFF